MAKTNPQLGVEYVDIGKLKRAAKNPRRNESAIPRVVASIERFGWTNPILARRQDKTIVAGHTRLEAARRLGIAKVPVIWLDLDERDGRLYGLADNRLAEIADWDMPALADVVRGLLEEDAPLRVAGFDDDELEALLASADAERLSMTEEASDAVGAKPAKPTSVAGELYELGPHRLLCGDSTSEADLEKALGPRQADMIFTDPPYGGSYQSHMAEGGTRARHRKIENDDLAPAQLEEFLGKVFAGMAAVLRNGGAFYVCHADQKVGIRPAFERALVANDFHISACIAWVKPAGTMGWQDYRNQYEPILYGWRKGAERRKVEDRTETNVWEIARDAAASYVHPTQKPVALPSRAIRNSSKRGEVVLDLFGGSGSTLIAAAKLGRRAVLVEKDAGYCDVIRRRWAKFNEAAGNRG